MLLQNTAEGLDSYENPVLNILRSQKHGACIVGYSEVVRSVFTLLLVQRLRVSRIAVFRAETEATEDHHFPAERLECVTPGSQRALLVLEVIERKALWQPDL